MDKVGTNENPPTHCLVCGNLVSQNVAKTGRALRNNKRIIYHAACASGVDAALATLAPSAHKRASKTVSTRVIPNNSDKEE